MVHDDTRANELTAALEEPTPSPQPTSLRKQVEVAVQGRRVVVLLDGEGISLHPDQALHLATVIRLKANEILNAEHRAMAKIRREQKEKRK